MRRRIGILLAAAVGATWLLAAPASADDTTVTFTVTTGAIDISAPTGPVTLTNGTLTPGGTTSGQIGTVERHRCPWCDTGRVGRHCVIDNMVGPCGSAHPLDRRFLLGRTRHRGRRGPLRSCGRGSDPHDADDDHRGQSHRRREVATPARGTRRSALPSATTAATVTYTAIVQHLVVGL